MALSPDQRRRLLRMNMLMSYAAFASSKATPAAAQDGALTVLGDEWNGFALDFTDNTVAMRVSLGAETLTGSGPSSLEAKALGLDFTDNTSALRV